MHTLYKDGEDNECHIGMGNTEGKTYTHSLRQRKVRWEIQDGAERPLLSSWIFGVAVTPRQKGRREKGRREAGEAAVLCYPWQRYMSCGGDWHLRSGHALPQGSHGTSHRGRDLIGDGWAMWWSQDCPTNKHKFPVRLCSSSYLLPAPSKYVPCWHVIVPTYPL